MLWTDDKDTPDPTPRAPGGPAIPSRPSVIDDILHEAARLLWCLALFLFVAWIVLGSVGFWRAAFHG